jgi:hypothetical protein
VAEFSTDTSFLPDLFGGGQTYDVPGIDWGGLFADPGFLDWLTLGPGLTPNLGGEQQYFLDTQNPGSPPLTLAQVLAIDPTFQAPAPSGGIAGLPGAEPSTPQTGTNLPTGAPASPQQLSTLEQTLRLVPGTLSAFAGLGLSAAAIAGLFGAGGVGQPGTATQTTTTTPNAITSPQVQQLLGSPGTVTAGGAGAGGYTGGTGLQGAAGQASSNLQGPQGLLQGQINAIPQLNPAIQAAIGQNALGFSQGNVPTLNNPQAQGYFDNILGGQNASVDYQTANSLEAALQSLRGRGFAGGAEVFREGAPAAAMGPVVAQGNAQRAMNRGNVDAQRLAYATQLPRLGADLAAAQMNQAQIPFGAYTDTARTQSQIPLELLRLLTGQGGSSSVQTSTGASPNFLQTLAQLVPVLGAAGGAFNAPSVTGSPANALTGAPGQPSLFDQYAQLFGSRA